MHNLQSDTVDAVILAVTAHFQHRVPAPARCQLAQDARGTHMYRFRGCATRAELAFHIPPSLEVLAVHRHRRDLAARSRWPNTRRIDC